MVQSKICSQCRAANPLSAQTCFACGQVLDELPNDSQFDVPESPAVAKARLLSARIMFAIGVLCLLGTTCIGLAIPLMMALPDKQATPAGLKVLIACILGVAILILGGLGVAYLYLRKRVLDGDKKAVSIAIWVALVHSCLAGLSLAGNLLNLSMGKPGAIGGAAIAGLYFAGLVQLVMNLKTIQANDRIE